MMSEIEWVKILLTSTLVSGVVSAGFSFLVSSHLKKMDYRNDYFKKLIEKRLEAYSALERFIVDIKYTKKDVGAKPYHYIFSEDFGRLEYSNSLLANAALQNIWFSEDTIQELRIMNQLFYEALNKCENKTREEIMEVGKEMYVRFANARHSIEIQFSKDFSALHEVSSFLKSKQQGISRFPTFV